MQVLEMIRCKGLLVGVAPKIGGKTPKMDGENFMEDPMNKWDDFGGQNHIFGNTHVRKDGNHTIQFPKDDVKGTMWAVTKIGVEVLNPCQNRRQWEALNKGIKAVWPISWLFAVYVPGSKLPLFPYNRGWSSTQ